MSKHGTFSQVGWAGPARVARRMGTTLLSLVPHSQQFADAIVVSLCVYFKPPNQDSVLRRRISGCGSQLIWPAPQAPA